VSIYFIGGPINPIALPSTEHQEFLSMVYLDLEEKQIQVTAQRKPDKGTESEDDELRDLILLEATELDSTSTEPEFLGVSISRVRVACEATEETSTSLVVILSLGEYPLNCVLEKPLSLGKLQIFPLGREATEVHSTSLSRVIL
jgi:hypothetical protein